jgi:hypothetical protein
MKLIPEWRSVKWKQDYLDACKALGVEHEHEWAFSHDDDGAGEMWFTGRWTIYCCRMCGKEKRVWIDN